MAVDEIHLYRASLPLVEPYKVSSLVFRTFDPIVVEVRQGDRTGWAETVVGPGYTDETDAGAWAFCEQMARRIKGLVPAAATQLLAAHLAEHSHAASVMISALEMLSDAPLLELREPVRIPLLVPVQSATRAAIRDEVESHVAAGFGTLKVKIGFGVSADLERIGWIQDAAGGRALLRLDANQAYDERQATSLARSIDPASIELLEQPCPKDDWDANAAVAKVSRVPLMLDESIYGLADIDRAARLEGVRYVKVKINKLGGVERLKRGLDHIRARGLEPVLGNGVATDISCWMEACVARGTITHAGEMNGWLKLRRPLFENPMVVEGGAIVLPAGYRPVVDRAALMAGVTQTHSTC